MIIKLSKQISFKLRKKPHIIFFIFAQKIWYKKYNHYTKSPMKIAIVINTSWNIYNFRRGLVEAIIKAGHEVVAIAPKDEYSVYLQEMGCEFYPVTLSNKGTNPMQDLYYMFQLFNIYRKIKPQVILQYTIKPNIYGTFASLPFKCLIINNVSGLGTVFLHNSISSRIAKFLYKLSFRFPKKVFFQNRDDRQLFIDNSLIEQKTTGLLPGSGIPLDKFSPKPFERNEIFTFLMIGRLLYDKGILEYANASKILQEKGIKMKCLVLGKIEPQKNLGVPAEMVKEWENQGIMYYLGTTDNVASIISQADCVVLPSYREGTPRALLEASAMAKPLVATDVVGCKETIDNGKNGYLCEVKNAKDLAEKMLQVYNLNDEDLKKMGEESRKKVENEFDEKIVIKKYLDTINAYQSLLERKKKC